VKHSAECGNFPGVNGIFVNNSRPRYDRPEINEYTEILLVVLYSIATESAWRARDMMT